jgi:FkbM family methyltransferase
MGTLNRYTPFRQMARVYSSMLSLADTNREISNTLAHLSAQLGAPASPPQGQSQPDSGAAVPIAIYPRLGYQFLLDRTSLVDRTVIETGTWEPGQQNYLQSLAARLRDQPNNVFLDIGAYWGLYSFLMAQTGIFQQIVAFEADAHNFSQFQSNIFLNRAAQRIKAYNKAVTAQDQTMHAWDSLTHPDGNRGGVGMVAADDERPSAVVEGVAIDSFLQLRDANLVIKIDVEGHEQHVLAGMLETARRNRVILQVEIYEPQMAATLPILERMGLRRIHQIEHDYYYTNFDPALLGH